VTWWPRPGAGQRPTRFSSLVAATSHAGLIRKSTMSRQAAVPGAAQRSRVQAALRADSRGGFEGDLVAEGLQLADVVALGALSVEAGVVEAGA
jgi:hypothetical protein